MAALCLRDVAVSATRLLPRSMGLGEEQRRSEGTKAMVRTASCLDKKRSSPLNGGLSDSSHTFTRIMCRQLSYDERTAATKQGTKAKKALRMCSSCAIPLGEAIHVSTSKGCDNEYHIRSKHAGTKDCVGGATGEWLSQ